MRPRALLLELSTRAESPLVVFRDQSQLVGPAADLTRSRHRNHQGHHNNDGLVVDAELDLGTYEKGIKISDQQIRDLEASQLHRHEFHGDWNYTPDTATRPNTPT